MNNDRGNTTTVAEPTVKVEKKGAARAGQTNATCGASEIPFEQAKHLLSSKPLRLPKALPKK